MKPANPFRPGSLIWSVMEGDWSDLTPKQIGEVLGTSGRSDGADHQDSQDHGLLSPPRPAAGPSKCYQRGETVAFRPVHRRFTVLYWNHFKQTDWW